MTPRKLVLGAALLLAALSPLAGQQQPFSGTPQLLESVERLNQLGSVLMIAAHPDDERTGVLAYFARGRHMRTAYLSVTRGEGGQNLIGPEQGAALGVIRTQELLAARQIDGAEQFFTRAIDFGFSKTAAETMQKWGHDRILADIVWVIRSYRPNVVILVFTGGSQDGHGHHQVSAILGKEAFAAAADPARFPEQLRYVGPWQATRIVHALWNFGPPGGRGLQPPPGGERPRSPQLPPAGQVETGAFNPVLGYSYEELAVLSRSMHHSQGTGAMRRPGASTAEFGLLAGQPAPSDLFDGIDTTWNRLSGGAPVAPILAEAIKTFEPEHPEKIVPLLVKARPLIAAVDDPLAREKLAELDEAIAGCAGIWIDAQAHEPEAVPGRPFAITTTVLNRSTQAGRTCGRAHGRHVGSGPAREAGAARLQPAGGHRIQPRGAARAALFAALLAAPASFGRRLHSRRPAPHRPGRYAAGGACACPIAGGRSSDRTGAPRPVSLCQPRRGRAHPPPGGGSTGRGQLAAAGRRLPFPRPARRPRGRGSARGQGRRRIAPGSPTGWKVEPATRHFEIAARGDVTDLSFTVAPPSAEATASLRAVATVGGREIS